MVPDLLRFAYYLVDYRTDFRHSPTVSPQQRKSKANNIQEVRPTLQGRYQIRRRRSNVKVQESRVQVPDREESLQLHL